uniref:Putative VRR-NUC domain-containing protein n=1 Tax=viral metagenome TaxID=1070528 RepID=A0A6H2A2Z6_9ZZZZ
MKLSEAQVKQAVDEYLTYQMNQGNLWKARLNAGDFIEMRGNTRRRIKGVGKGTADFIMIKPVFISIGGYAPRIPSVEVIFIEVKSTTGKQSPEQVDFENMAIGLGCKYALVRSIEDLERLASKED